ncbi:MAG: hypothetical protein LUE64_01850, partial [Candidatus Gastranaerophilales bacterium]|nr:hypothetical protein [Candidatus Gastranaerophilales bacterium]
SSIREAEQTAVDDYISSIDVSSATTLSELEALYASVSSVYTEYSGYGISSLDLSGFETVLSSIREAEQTAVDDYISSITVSASSVSEFEALYASVSSVYAEYSGYGISELDLSGFDTIFASIIAGEQTLVDTSTQNVSGITDSVVFDEENFDSALSAYNSAKIQLVQASLILAQVTIEGVDTSALKSAIEKLRANIEEFESQYKAYIENLIVLNDTDTDDDTEETSETGESEETEEADNNTAQNYNNNSTTIIDNSTTIIDNSTTDNSTTDNSTTDNSYTDNSTTDNSDNSYTDNSYTDNSDNSTTDNSTTDNSDNSYTDNSTGTDTTTDTTETEDAADESDSCEEEDELNPDVGVGVEEAEDTDSDDKIEIEQTEE